MTPIDLANAPLVKAGIAGQVHTAVFHVDELAQIEFNTKKKWHLIAVPASIKAGLHYGSVLASKKAIADNKEGVIRFLEGWIIDAEADEQHQAGRYGGVRQDRGKGRIVRRRRGQGRHQVVPRASITG